MFVWTDGRLQLTTQTAGDGSTLPVQLQRRPDRQTLSWWLCGMPCPPALRKRPSCDSGAIPDLEPRYHGELGGAFYRPDAILSSNQQGESAEEIIINEQIWLLR